MGLAGISQSCFDAVKRLIQYGDPIERTLILTAGDSHCLLLILPADQYIAVKSGFSSGYSGEGPRTFAEALALLRFHEVDIDECEVGQDLLDRLDASALSQRDLETIKSARLIRPMRLGDYIYPYRESVDRAGRLWSMFPPVMPWAIIDPRIADLALLFFERPDDCILKGWRRLEQRVRDRIGPADQRDNVFATAFQGGDKARLTWEGLNVGEIVGRSQLFVSAYKAYRNPRAHRELDGQAMTAMLMEFLMLNQLYHLERSAVEPTAKASSGSPQAGADPEDGTGRPKNSEENSHDRFGRTLVDASPRAPVKRPPGALGEPTEEAS